MLHTKAPVEHVKQLEVYESVNGVLRRQRALMLVILGKNEGFSCFFLSIGGLMTRYFFDLHNGDGETRDEQGVELGSRDAVTQEILLDVARDELPDRNRTDISVLVRTDIGKTGSVATLTFRNQWLD